MPSAPRARRARPLRERPHRAAGFEDLAAREHAAQLAAGQRARGVVGGGEHVVEVAVEGAEPLAQRFGVGEVEGLDVADLDLGAFVDGGEPLSEVDDEVVEVGDAGRIRGAVEDGVPRFEQDPGRRHERFEAADGKGRIAAFAPWEALMYLGHVGTSFRDGASMSRLGERPTRSGGALARVRLAPMGARAPPAMQPPYTVGSSLRQGKLAEDLDLLLNRIGLRILRRRQELGLSQKALAERLGTGATNIGRIERGEQNVTLGTLHKIATELDTTVLDLLDAEPRSAASKR